MTGGFCFSALTAFLARGQVLFGAERDRWFLWTPVIMGLGIGLYFSLSREPFFGIGPLGLLGAVSLWGWLHRRGKSPLFALILCLFMAGFTAAQVRTRLVTTPLLTHEVGPTRLEGTLVSAEALPGEATRIVLKDVVIPRLAADKTPHRVRLKIRTQSPPAGARIAILAVLAPPASAALPDGFDFRRQAFFQQIGGVGYAVGKPEILSLPATSTVHNVLEDARQSIGAQLKALMPQPALGIMHALMTGEQTAVTPDTANIMRQSGLSHLLSISGVHIGMVAGGIFFFVRALLALCVPLALRYPIKKWAAMIALLSAALYTILVDSPVPAQRSLFMGGFVFVGIMLDRAVISLRMVAVAALFILVFQPESLLGASFQMSFAAVVALIAAYERLKAPLHAWKQGRGRVGRFFISAASLALTSIIATLATMPFGLYHFQQTVLYGVLANMIAVPLTGVVVMPAVIIAYLLMPIGLAFIPLKIAEIATDFIIDVAAFTASIPFSQLLLPAMPFGAFLVIVGGGLWLCLWQKPWRLAGIVAILGGMACIGQTAAPDVLISPEGTLFAVRAPDGHLLLSSQRAEKFDRATWLRYEGQTLSPLHWPDNDVVHCDALGCLYRPPHAPDQTVAFITDIAAAQEDCATARVVITALDLSSLRCRAPLVIDRQTLRRHGAHALYVRKDKITLSPARPVPFGRPWSGVY